MAGFNLLRNARAFFTTNLTSAADPSVAVTGALSTNTFEIQVLGGLSFSQSTNAQNITVSEAGGDPSRGQRSFNTSLAPVEFSFSTYVRPSGTTTIDCEEKVLWNALLSSKAVDTTGLALAGVTGFTRTASLDTVTFTFTPSVNLTTAGIAVGDTVTISGILGTDAQEWNQPVKITGFTGTLTACTGLTIVYLKAPTGTGTAPTTPPTTFKIHKGAVTQHLAAGTEGSYLLAHSGTSNKNQLQAFGMVIVIDSATYLLDNCALNQVSVDFGLDGITTLAWTGNATAIRSVAATTGTAGTLTGGFGGTYTQKNTAAKYITNKLSTVVLKSTIRGAGTTPKTYALALTGGNFTISNNINYITPENLGVVNSPVTYYTGTRAISGSFNAYLKTGSLQTSILLEDMLAASATSTEPKFYAEIQIGGGANTVKVEVEMPAVTLQIPTIDAGGDILSTTINFTSQGFDGASSTAAANDAAAFDVENTNDLFVRYYSA